jgi:hypothetical protein
VVSKITAASDTGDYFTDTAFPTLLPQHLAMLTASGILPEVIATRGYRSVKTRTELRRLGFSEAQGRCVPSLVIPTFRPCGQPGLIQMRPDEPRRFSDGRIAKYEMPGKERMCLDVPPAVRKHIGNPNVPLFITEGIKKGDALASLGACTVALMGVTCWRGTNEDGGKMSLPDWHDIALNGRDVYIVFDSDVMRKWEVYQALVSLREWLQGKGSTVFLVYLPTGDAGAKTGVDDYLATGKTLDDLLRLATAELMPAPDRQDRKVGIPYRETPQGLIWNKPGKDGVTPTAIANFTARIVAEVVADDGVEVEREYRIEAERQAGEGQKRKATFLLPATQFNAMQWPALHLGAFASVTPGLSALDQARYAIRILSGEPPEERVFTHTGWREIGGKWVYLHAGGCIGQGGAGVSVRLPDTLNLFSLPLVPEGDDLRRSVEATLSLLDLEFAPDRLTFPLLASVFRAVMGSADFSMALVGRTQAFKSELTALCQRFFGPEMDRTHLPGSWSSTENSLEELAFIAKDALLSVDDFVPGSGDNSRLHSKAERVLRAQGNGSGRQRMRKDGTMRPARPPRGIILLTGEDVPQGESLRARMFILDVQKGEVKTDALSIRQEAAAVGLYAETTAAFANWISPCYEDAAVSMKENALYYRNQAQQGESMRRTPGIVGNLYAAFDLFAKFVVWSKVRTEEEAQALRARCWAALLEAAAAQENHQQSSEPTQRFVDLIRQSIASGRAHLADEDGKRPTDAQSWGWRPRHTSGYEPDWEPKGERIGYIEGSNVYLLPDAAYAVAQGLSGSTEGVTLTPTTLWKRLKEANLLRSVDATRGTMKIRKVLAGKTESVLHFSVEALISGET